MLERVVGTPVVVAGLALLRVVRPGELPQADPAAAADLRLADLVSGVLVRADPDPHCQVVE